MKNKLLITIWFITLSCSLYAQESYMNLLTDGSSKTWVLDSLMLGHVGLGPSDSNTPDWWTASPMNYRGGYSYDDEFTFSTDGSLVINTHGSTQVAASIFSNNLFSSVYPSLISSDNTDANVITDDSKRGSLTFSLSAGTPNEQLIMLNSKNGFIGKHVTTNLSYKILKINPIELHLKVLDINNNSAWFVKLIKKSLDIDNNSPTDILLSTTHISIKTSQGAGVATLSNKDLSTRDAFLYSLVTGNGNNDVDNSLFQINGTTLQINVTPSKTEYKINVKVTDIIGHSFTKALVLTVDPNAPTDITISRTEFQEGIEPLSVIATLSTTDATPNDVFSYTVWSDVWPYPFTILGNKLLANIVPSYKKQSSYTIHIYVKDAHENTFDKQFVLNVLPSQNTKADSLIINIHQLMVMPFNYETIGNILIGDILGCNAWKGGQNTLDYVEIQNSMNVNNRLKLNTHDQIWQGQYVLINECGLALEALNKLSLTNIQKARLTAELRAIRANSYFNLVRAFGGVPVLSKFSRTDSISIPRNSVKEVWQYIESELNASIPDLVLRNQLSENGAFRISKGAAQSFLLRAYVYQKKWSEASNVASQIVNSGQFILEPNYADIFSASGNQSLENVFFIQPFSEYCPGWSRENKGNNLVSSFTMANGKENRGWNFVRPVKGFINAFEINDKRLKASVYGTGENIEDDVIKDFYPYFGTYPADCTSYACKKYYLPLKYILQKYDQSSSPLTIKTIRYADVLLYYAEALNEQGKTTEALVYLNMIRQRAGLSEATASSQADIKAAIMNERRTELGLEGHRYWDLVRTGKIKDEYQQQALPFTVGVHELFPIPISVIMKSNYLIKQNPGYYGYPDKYHTPVLSKLIPNQTIISGSAKVVSLNMENYFTELDGSPLSYSYQLTSPYNVSVDTTSTGSIISITEKVKGISYLQVTATNPSNLSVTSRFKVFVNVEGNHNPIASQNVILIEQDPSKNYEIDLKTIFSDPDGDDLTYYTDRSISFIHISGSKLTIDKNNFSYLYEFNIVANDSKGGMAKVISIYNPLIGNYKAPVQLSPLADVNITYGKPFSFSILENNFNKPPKGFNLHMFSNSLTQDSIRLPWLNFNYYSDSLSCSGVALELGTYKITLTVFQDSLGHHITRTFSSFNLIVEEEKQLASEQIKITAGVGSSTIVLGKQIFDSFIGLATENIQYTATQSDGSALPSWVTFDPVTLTFTFTKKATKSLQPINFKITAKDQQGHMAVVDFSVQIGVDISTQTLPIAAPANSTNSFNITSQSSWSVVSDQTWLSVNNVTGTNNSTIVLTATANPKNTTRTAVVTVSGIGISDKKITVTQDFVITGVNEISENLLTLFPNPIINELTVNNISRNATISIYDLNGKLLINKIANSTIEKIDVSSLANGVYSIKISENNTTKTSKLIKQ